MTPYNWHQILHRHLNLDNVHIRHFMYNSSVSFWHFLLTCQNECDNIFNNNAWNTLFSLFRFNFLHFSSHHISSIFQVYTPPLEVKFFIQNYFHAIFSSLYCFSKFIIVFFYLFSRKKWTPTPIFHISFSFAFSLSFLFLPTKTLKRKKMTNIKNK